MDLFLKKNRHLTYFISFTLRISKDRDFIHCDVLQDSILMFSEKLLYNLKDIKNFWKNSIFIIREKFSRRINKS